MGKVIKKDKKTQPEKSITITDLKARFAIVKGKMDELAAIHKDMLADLNKNEIAGLQGEAVLGYLGRLIQENI